MKEVDYALYVTDLNANRVNVFELLFGKYVVHKTPNFQFIQARYDLVNDQSEPDLALPTHMTKEDLLPKAYFGAFHFRI